MSSMFDVPQHLIMLLALAVSGGDAGRVTPAPPAPAMAAASAASSPITFRDQVWLEALKCGAGGEELAGDAVRVFRTSGGRYYVPVESDRRQIMELKRDADIAALVAFGFARCNGAVLRNGLSREPSAGELYIAHVLGGETALDLIRLAGREPETRLKDRWPEIAAALGELKDARGPTATVGAVVSRMKAGVERRPSGEEVAAWFANGQRMTLGLPLKGAVSDAAHAEPDIRFAEHSVAGWGWSAVVTSSVPALPQH